MSILKQIAPLCCILTMIGGVALTLVSCGWAQLDGIAIILASGLMLPYLAKE